MHPLHHFEILCFWYLANGDIKLVDGVIIEKTLQVMLGTFQGALPRATLRRFACEEFVRFERKNECVSFFTKRYPFYWT